MSGLIINPYSFSGYSTSAVTFDGTNDYMSISGNLTGAADGKKGTISFWIKFNGGNGTTQTIAAITLSSSISFTVNRTTSNTINIVGRQSPNGSVAVNISSVATITSASGWVNVLASWDASINAYNIYLNNTSSVTGSTVNANIDYAAGGNVWIGATATAANKINADLSDFYFNTVEYVDLSNSANREKFINQSTLKPVNLGADGSTPTGTQPICFQKCASGAAASTFATNLGSGGNFTITGTLTTASTSPSD